MKYEPHPDSRFIGTFRLGTCDKPRDIKKAVLKERERAASVHGRNTLFRYEKSFTTISTRVRAKWSRSKFEVPEPGDGTVKHDQRTQKAIEACQKVGAEFWCFGGSNWVWGVRDREYVEVML